MPYAYSSSLHWTPTVNGGTILKDAMGLVTMKYHDEFEWDPTKAKDNQKKHGVTFALAAKVLADEQAEMFHHEEPDDAHSMQEDRHITLASYPFDRSIIVKICWTDRSSKGKQITRIISACKAKRRERILYEKAITKGK